jgi:hypothetical protein
MKSYTNYISSFSFSKHSNRGPGRDQKRKRRSVEVAMGKVFAMKV